MELCDLLELNWSRPSSHLQFPLATENTEADYKQRVQKDIRHTKNAFSSNSSPSKYVSIVHNFQTLPPTYNL